jgi:hypothetical protein
MLPADGAEWSVGNVQSTTEGYGFNILNKFRAPVASFSYSDMALAQASHDLGGGTGRYYPGALVSRDG